MPCEDTADLCVVIMFEMWEEAENTTSQSKLTRLFVSVLTGVSNLKRD